MHLYLRSTSLWMPYEKKSLRLVTYLFMLRLLHCFIKKMWWFSLTKHLQKQPKKVLCSGVVRKMQSAWFVPTNERPEKNLRPGIAYLGKAKRWKGTRFWLYAGCYCISNPSLLTVSMVVLSTLILGVWQYQPQK